VNSGLVPTLTILVGALLWLVYLAPSLRERAETRAIERDARRIVATTQDLGIRPSTPMTEMSTRELALHRRELERLAKSTERHAEQTRRREVFAQSPSVAARHRVMKITLSLVVLLSLVGAGVAVSLVAWSYLVLAIGFALLGVIGLIAVNTADVAPATPVARPKAAPVPVAKPETWTPIRTPPVHNSIPEGAGLIVTDEHAKAIAARERAARIREQAARTAQQPEVAPDPRFTEPAIDTETTGTFDINAALRARRAN
jgi:hypothetical protein